MRRRDFLCVLGGAAVAQPFAARAQQAMPLIGFLHAASAEPNAKRLASFTKGLAEAGFVAGQNVAIEFRWADGQPARLPTLAADLVRRRVSVIATLSSNAATAAAKAATTTIPIVFQVGADPVEMGLVESLNRPGGNATGISNLNAELVAKRLALLRELAPQSTTIGGLLNPINPSTGQVVRDLQAAARRLGMQFDVLRAGTEAEISAAFSTIAQKPGSMLLVNTDALFLARRGQLVTLAAHHAVPTIYYNREYVVDGGLISYGTDSMATWRQAGGYVGRILKGEKPADLPVAQPAKFELVINLKTAKALGLTVPQALLVAADEVIE
jgi:putative ABC transport system substrate-binding protein